MIDEHDRGSERSNGGGGDEPAGSVSNGPLDGDAVAGGNSDQPSEPGSTASGSEGSDAGGDEGVNTQPHRDDATESEDEGEAQETVVPDHVRKGMEIALFVSMIVKQSDADVFLYNGGIARGYDLKFIEEVHKNRSRDNVILFLVTNGGSPDAAYKMARYLQEKYTKFTLVVAGLCKSAGTLVAVGAHELAFAPYGELGPLDIQSYKTDNLAGMESGLTINEAIESLTNQAIRKHGEHYARIITSTGRVVSFQSAAKVATELVTGLFAPIFERIDPYDVGQKARSMRIAMDYGKRLGANSGNLKDASSLDQLARSYPSHSFVINRDEASELFTNVRVLSDAESLLVDALGLFMRDDVEQMKGEPIITCLSMKNGGTSAEPETEGDAVPDSEGAAGARADAAAQPDAGSGGKSPTERSPQESNDA